MEYFCPKNFVTGKLHLTENSYTIHYYDGSWIPSWKKKLLKLWLPFEEKFPNLAARIKKLQ